MPTSTRITKPGSFSCASNGLLEDFNVAAFRLEFTPVAADLNMTWHLELSSDEPRVAIFVSQQLHCLADLLYRHQAGELACSIPLHNRQSEAGRALAEFYGIDFITSR